MNLDVLNACSSLNRVVLIDAGRLLLEEIQYCSFCEWLFFILHFLILGCVFVCIILQLLSAVSIRAELGYLEMSVIIYDEAYCLCPVSVSHGNDLPMIYVCPVLRQIRWKIVP